MSKTLEIFVSEVIRVKDVVLGTAIELIKKVIKFLREQVSPFTAKIISKAHRTLAPPVKITILIERNKKGGTK